MKRTVSREYCLGIDLGTTNTLAAVWPADAPGPSILPIWQPDKGFSANQFDRLEILPSAIRLRENRVYVGSGVHSARHSHTDHIITSIKREMGERTQRVCHQRAWTPAMLSGCILKAVAQEARGQFGGPPRKVVITVPASFGTEARRATLQAARMAGFNLECTHLFDEPVAAFLHQLQQGGHDRDFFANRPLTRCLIIDIGGGTNDVALLQVSRHGEELQVDVRGRSRYNDTAGDDFDLNIAALLLERFVRDAHTTADAVAGSDEARMAFAVELLNEAQRAKQTLCEQYKRQEESMMQTGPPRPPSCAVTVKQVPGGLPWSTTLTMEDLRVALKGFFSLPGDRRRAALHPGFFRPIQQCLDSARDLDAATGERPFADEDIDKIYLAGGSAGLPMIAKAVGQMLGKSVQRVKEPINGVALGAGWRAGDLCGYLAHGLQLSERLFDGLYLQTEDGSFQEILSPHCELPVTDHVVPDRFFMPNPDRRLEIELFTGTGPNDPFLVPLARSRVKFPDLLPARHPIELRISVSANRDISLTFTTIHHDKQVQGDRQISAAGGWRANYDAETVLPPVNEPIF